MREIFEPRVMFWMGDSNWSWGAAMGDCLCETCKKGISWHSVFEFNLSKISQFVDSEEGFVKYIDDAWLGFFILTRLRYLRVNGYWNGRNEPQILTNIMKSVGATLA